MGNCKKYDSLNVSGIWCTCESTKCERYPEVTGRSPEMKEARDVAIEIAKTYRFMVGFGPPGPEALAEFEAKVNQAAQLIAAFALKQKGEVVWEGNGRVGSIDMYKVIYPEGLYRDDVPPNGEYHVTISLPQQEQE